MDKSSDFVSRIVHFPPLNAEENESSVSLLFSKFFKFGRNSPNGGEQPPVVPVAAASSSASLCRSEESTRERREQSLEENDSYDLAGSSVYSDDYPEERSMQKVLKRISNLVARSNSSVTRYADTEQPRYWMSDSVSRECYECGARFSTFRRRHHCRVCGQIFCARCCSHRVPGQVVGCMGGLRVCTYCCQIVLKYTQAADSGVALSSDLKMLQDNIKDKASVDNSQSPDQGFLLGGDSIKDNCTIDAAEEMGFTRVVSLQDTYRLLCIYLPLQQHRYRLLRYPSVWRGGDILQWLLEHGNVSTRIQACELCQSMLSEGLVECVTEHSSFTDYALYRPINLPVLAAFDQYSSDPSKSMSGSTSSYCLNLNLTENSAHLMRGQRSGTESNNEIQNGNDNCIPTQLQDSNDQLGCKSVESAGAEHLRLLLVQSLVRASLNLSWAPTLLPLLQDVANMITPDVISCEWDIRRCVRVKRVAGGSMHESCAVGGVVFTKNIAHRSMSNHLTSPRLLLLRCSIVYQRVESKLMSLEPLLMQEQEYLHNCCARILALAPDIIVVQGSVSRLAQDELRNRGKVLVVGVRAPTLQRLARCTNADILTSIDACIGAHRLGMCKTFHLMNYESKTLMVFECFAKDMKGCSVILRGGSLEELSRVKNVLGLILLAAYNWRLESSFLGDMGATIPVSSTSLMFTDNSKDNSPEKNDCGGGGDGLRDANDANMSDPECVSKNNSSSNESKRSIATTDPLTSEAFYKSKKNEADRGSALSFGTAVDDFSDPLRSRQMLLDDEVFVSLQMDSSSSKPLISDNPVNTLRNRWSADEAVLSMSPHVRICAPFLETDVGRKSSLRLYFCTPLFPTPVIIAPSTPRPNRIRKSSVKTTNKDLHLKKPHTFISNALVHNAEDVNVLSNLALFRAYGGRLPHANFIKKIEYMRTEMKDESVVKPKGPPDPLDPEQHQRMYLLYYSYCLRSPNAPDFCINPMIVRMEMYGNNDLSLGQFLERHCFAQQYICPSPSCQIPQMHHVRNFIHGDGCITVTCAAVDGNATAGAQALFNDEDGKSNIMWWCRCMACGERGGSSGSLCLRPISLAVSLSKYLELRFNAPRYIRNRSCHHSLNQQYSHYFASGNITACFRYKKIKTWDIFLPPSSLCTHYNTRQIRDFLVNQVNDLILKGHEVFSKINNDGEHDKEHASFWQHTKKIQYDLTSSSLQEQSNDAGIIKSLWHISDTIVVGEKLLQDSYEKWTAQTNAKTGFKITQDNIIDGEIESDDSQTESAGVDCIAENKNVLTNSSEQDTAVEEEEDKGDKKGLRTMLSQLLNNSQRAHQNGIVLCSGIIPIVVKANEISSLISAALASPQYHQQLHSVSQSKGYGTDSDEKEGNSKEKTEIDSKSKNSKTYEHIDVQLQDGIFCRVFHPKQFVKLRSLLLCPLQSNSNIINDFDLKQTPQNDADVSAHNNPSDDTAAPIGDKDHETILKNAVPLEDREVHTSVEASPVIGCRKDDKSKRASRDVQSKMNAVELTEIEEAFIRSLSHCVPWAARGGKSGSTFCKTKDDRFILKEMSRLELQLFVDFAPHYFNYVQSNYQNNYPTLLARIFGVYKVGGVEGVGGGVLVMENLWHGRKDLAHRFDLKGAQRNRLADQGAPDVVLLDENLLNYRWESPIFLQSHSAHVLFAAVERDTTFLSQHHIMDYSLLAGLDEEKQELVLGIIDYIRTFTWDKRLEHIVKKGLGSTLPTIVSPEQYKSRFCVAMKKYFLQCPNQWEELSKGLICDYAVDS